MKEMNKKILKTLSYIILIIISVYLLKIDPNKYAIFPLLCCILGIVHVWTVDCIKEEIINEDNIKETN